MTLKNPANLPMKTMSRTSACGSESQGLALEWRTEARGDGDLTVQVLNKLFGPQANNYVRSLDKLSLRQNVLSGNLANINTPGYKRRDVDFAIELEQAQGLFQDPEAGGVKTIPGEVRIDGNGVDIEQEVFMLGENEIRYQTTTQMARGYFRGLKNVIREGR